MAFAENIDLFFDGSGFGVTALIGNMPVNGIFDSEYIESGFTGSTRPVFICKTSAIETIVEDSVLKFGGKTYKVKGPKEADGTGITTLILELQS